MRRALSVLLILIVIVISGYYLWPTVSDQFHKLMNERAISGYNARVSRMSVAQQNVMLAEAAEYNRILAETGATEEYGAQLDVYDGMMAVIELPQIGARLPVYHGEGARSRDLGVGHDPRSSLPVGGGGTHVLLSGVNTVAGARLLEGLETLKAGDLVYLTCMDDMLIYQVEERIHGEPESFVIMPNEDRVTLVGEMIRDDMTMWVTVTALRVGVEDVTALLSHDGVRRVPVIEAIFICAVPFAGLFSLYMLVFRRWRRDF